MKTTLGALAALVGVIHTAECQTLGSTFFESAAYGSSRNLGSSLSLFGGEMTVTARYRIDPNSTLDVDAAGPDGTIYLDANASPYVGGLGVQDAGGGSSTGISGGGPNQDEELIFTYNSLGAALNTVQIMINSFDSAASPVLFLDTDHGAFVFDETAMMAAGTNAGASGDASESWTISFANLAGTVGSPTAIVNSFTVRETGAHTFVRGVNGGTLIPEPGTPMLAALALPVLFRRRRYSGR